MLKYRQLRRNLIDVFKSLLVKVTMTTLLKLWMLLVHKDLASILRLNDNTANTALLKS
jgi:hypothetical protein